MANFYSYRPLPGNADYTPALHEMYEGQYYGHVAPARFRMTVVDSEHPMAGYPDGLYLEGWVEVPTDDPPFDFPLSATV